MLSEKKKQGQVWAILSCQEECWSREELHLGKLAFWCRRCIKILLNVSKKKSLSKLKIETVIIYALSSLPHSLLSSAFCLPCCQLALGWREGRSASVVGRDALPQGAPHPWTRPFVALEGPD